VVGCWHGYLSGARCRLAYGPADATATLSLASLKSRLVLPFWYRLTRVVPEKGPLNGCVCVCHRPSYRPQEALWFQPVCPCVHTQACSQKLNKEEAALPLTLPIPSPFPLEIGPLPRLWLRVLGEHSSSPNGSGRSPAAKRTWGFYDCWKFVWW